MSELKEQVFERHLIVKLRIVLVPGVGGESSEGHHDVGVQNADLADGSIILKAPEVTH